jgi:hypothetical protein
VDERAIRTGKSRRDGNSRGDGNSGVGLSDSRGKIEPVRRSDSRDINKAEYRRNLKPKQDYWRKERSDSNVSYDESLGTDEVKTESNPTWSETEEERRHRK